MRARARAGGRACWIGLAASLLAAPGARAGELQVAAAVSLREPLLETAERYEAEHPGTRIRLAFGASSALAAQLRAGAPVDVLASADERIIDALVAEGRVSGEDRVVLARNRLTVMVAPDLAVPLASPEDLARPEVRRIAVPAEAVPVGRYAREWLRGRGLLERLEPRLVQTSHARATLAAVDAGNADAAIVYASDVRLARWARLAFEVPADEQPRIVYAAARVVQTRRPELAASFLAFLAGPSARAAFERAGFRAPRP